jgi:alanine dehydrogenase
MDYAAVSLLCISGADIMRLVDPAKALDALAEGFRMLSRGEVDAPPRPKVEVPGKGFSLAMMAAAPGQQTAIKVVNVYEGNHDLGLASHQALVNLFDRETGQPLAVLDGASLTGIRTAAAAVLSVREIARPDASVALVVGSGVQAREHLRYLPLARKFSEIRLYARDAAKARALANAFPGVTVATDLAQATATADVVCLTTASRAPVIQDAWVKPGAHVTSVGYAPPDTELPRPLIDRAAIFVEAKTAFQPAPVGCAELAGMDPSRGAELGEVLLGRKPGRTSAGQVTLYKSMGNAMEDMVVANLAFSEAQRMGIGQPVPI